ncbi:MAG: anthranilate synthase component I family protein, partial [Chlorobi bacterium]|nr:anthranilate synthase component I family protein [Chlorobiota bacterium]
MTDILEILRFIDNNEGASFFYTPLKNGDEVSYLFKSSSISIECDQKRNIEETLSRIDELKEEYPFAYGYIAYEVGYAFEERLEKLLDDRSGNKLISFHFCDDESVEKIKTKDVDFSRIKGLLTAAKTEINNFKLNTDYNTYKKNIQKIKDLIAKGDTYQVNYTLKSHFNFDGDVAELFLQLLFNQSASYTAIINDIDRFVISISPELFFKTEGDIITSKPMKGTIRRGRNIDDDNLQKRKLANSKKDKAENIMIVDLLRNDLGKICEINSVSAHPVYDIERYETVYQMTSTVKGKLRERSFRTIIKSLFPCGSITGAPKIRTMKIIKELELEERGVYTGTIGIIERGDYTFNIPIRTITIDKKSTKGELGIGGGIVWD